MVAKQTITSPFFANRGKLSQVMLRSLLVRGSGVPIDDALQRFGWDGAAGVATTVVTTNPASGMVAGVRYETQGVGPEVKFKARDLWKDADSNVMVNLSFKDLSKMEWSTEGEVRNFSRWIDGD